MLFDTDTKQSPLHSQSVVTVETNAVVAILNTKPDFS